MVRGGGRSRRPFRLVRLQSGAHRQLAMENFNLSRPLMSSLAFGVAQAALEDVTIWVRGLCGTGIALDVVDHIRGPRPGAREAARVDRRGSLRACSDGM